MPTHTPADHVCLISFHGDLDAAACDAVRRSFADVLGPRSRVVVDLARVGFVDSSGIGALAGGIRRIREMDGEVVLSGARRSVARTLRVTGLSRLVSLVETLEDAELALNIESR